MASARPVRSAAVITGAMLVLCGCAATPPEDDATPTPTPTPTATTMAIVSIDGAPITGTGTSVGMQQGIPFPIPEGDFRSVVLVVDCDGDGTIQVGIDDPTDSGLSFQRGACSETTTLEWPLTANTEKSLTVAIAEGVAWSITPRFSTAEFLVDPAIAADCTAYSKAYSLIYNADVGYSRYDDVDEEEWNERIDTAAAALADLADSSSSRLAEPFGELVPILRNPQRVPGDIMSAIGAQNSTISEACSANQSQVTFSADYGA